MRQRRQKFYGDMATTGRQETTTARKRRKARERRVDDCARPGCHEPQARDGVCDNWLCRRWLAGA